MQEQTGRTQKAITYGLMVIGILGIGFLGYIVGSHLISPEPESTPQASSETEVSVVENTEPEVETQPTETPEVPVGIRVGQRAPDFRLRTLNNESVALSDFIGTVVVLDFWASWCMPCKSTMPGLESLAKALASDVVLVGVSLDRRASHASDYLTSNGYDAMVALYESYDAAYSVFQTYGGGGIPKTYVIDREGIIRYVGHPASLPRQTVERLI